MDVSGLVQSQWLTARDIDNSPTKIVTILDNGKFTEEVATDGRKYQALVLKVQLDTYTKDWKPNRFTLKKLVEAFGKDTQTWTGKQLKVSTMLMQGGRMGVVLA